MKLIKDLEKCLDCNDSKSILIGVHNFGLFGDKVYLCDDCYNVRFGNNYFLKREPKKATHLRLISNLDE